MFRLDPRLAADTLPVGAFALSRVRLMNDAHFPWLVLVPARAGLQELTDLAPADRATLMEEIAAASRALRAVARPDKINVGVLGNIVAQLHVHVVARRRGDAAWPGPVWGAGTPEPYDDDDRARLLDALNAALPDLVQAK
ncbi:MAG: HIT domain-containing protein [Alphaproteobacteria bacterium]|nr:HIT domain-containing protein [Alphaproteobacteria bacterium]